MRYHIKMRIVGPIFVPGTPQTFGDKKYEEPWKEKIAQEVKKSYTSNLPIKNEVQIHLVFYVFEKRNVDLDNLIKPCIDAIGSVLFGKRKGASRVWDTDDYLVRKIFAEKESVGKKNEECVRIVVKGL